MAGAAVAESGPSGVPSIVRTNGNEKIQLAVGDPESVSDTLDINAVEDNLYIGSLLAANRVACNASLQRRYGISRILSIGCIIDESNDAVCTTPTQEVERFCYPDVLDKPEVSLFRYFAEWAEIINASITRDCGILVHCVHGQSRSASAVLAYMILRKYMSAKDACTHLKQRRPQLCVNPGFLCQLTCLSHCPSYPLLVETLFKPVATTPQLPVITPSSVDSIHCSRCNFGLVPQSSVLPHVDCSSVLSEQMDKFWDGYRPLHPRRVVTDPGTVSSACLSRLMLVGVVPTAWMKTAATAASKRSSDRAYKTKKRLSFDQTIHSFPKVLKTAQTSDVSDDRAASKNFQALRSTIYTAADCVILCPSCNLTVGFYKKEGLLVCGDYLVADLFALNVDNMKING
jgi:hypothetical protein